MRRNSSKKLWVMAVLLVASLYAPGPRAGVLHAAGGVRCAVGISGCWLQSDLQADLQADVPESTAPVDAAPRAGETRMFDGIEFVWVPTGEFRMGSTSSEALPDERPVTRVQISRGFWLGKYEVTQADWQMVMGTNPSEFSGCGQCPVENVSWNDAQGFIRNLNAQSGENRYRLPTEAEWEYASRAGTTGDRYGNVGAIAWYGEGFDGRTHPVGEKAPNAWGLHDMLGNVWEWVADWHGDYPGGTVTDPQGPESGSRRVNRGGNWIYSSRYSRTSGRSSNSPGIRFSDLGFRVLRTE